MFTVQRVGLMALFSLVSLLFSPIVKPLPAPDQPAGISGGARADRTLEPSLCCIRPGPAPEQTRKEFLPLKHTEVTGHISGMIAEVTVKQQFHNPLTDRLEAVYVFPLPETAAVHSLKITIKDRTIVGEVKTTEAARQTFDEARAAGQTAALVEQSRENIFTASVTNIPPGESVTVEITYYQTLTYDDGRYGFHFPMVVAPRYLGAQDRPQPQPPVLVEPQPAPLPADAPEAADNTRMPQPAPVAPDADPRRIQPPAWLNPADKRIGNITLKLSIDAGVGITAVKSPTHEITVNQTGNTTATVELTRKNEIPNKDFVLEYKIAGNAVQAAVLAHKAAGAETGYFMLMLVPKDEYDSEEILPKEMIYIVDHSGSMGTEKMAQAKLALKSSLHALNPEDTFTIVPFDNRVTFFSEKPLPFTQDNLDKADAFTAAIQSQGGTEILQPMQWALSQPADPERLKIVAFLTDGEVSNDEQVVAEVQKSAGPARVYTFGIGHGVNRWMLRKMAEYGHGGFETILPGENLEEKIARFNDRTSYPVLRDLTADFGGLAPKDLYPATMPDLFTSQPIVILGTYQKGGKYKVTVGGKNVNGDYSTNLNIDLPDTSEANAGLPVVWARARVEDLNDRLIKAQDRKPLQDEIRDLGLKFGLVTDYTSFVVVEKQSVNKDGQLVVEEVPVPMPEGWDLNDLTKEDDRNGEPSRKTKAGGRYDAKPMPGMGGGVQPGAPAPTGNYGGQAAGAMPPAPPAARPAPSPVAPAIAPSTASNAAPAVDPAGADGDNRLNRLAEQNEQAKKLALLERDHQVAQLQSQMDEYSRRKEAAQDKERLRADDGKPGEGAAPDAFLGDQAILDDQAEMLADVLRALAREQAVDGLWKETGRDVDFAALERSAIAVLCYHRAGETTRRGKFKAQLERAVEGLIKAQTEDGSYLPAADGGIRLQAEMALTLVEVYGSRNRDSYKAAAVKAIEALLKHQREDGLFPATAGAAGDKATTAFAQQALRRAMALHLGDFETAAAKAEKALPSRADQLLKDLAHAAAKVEAKQASNLDRITGMAFYLTYGE